MDLVIVWGVRFGTRFFVRQTVVAIVSRGGFIGNWPWDSFQILQIFVNNVVDGDTFGDIS